MWIATLLAPAWGQASMVRDFRLEGSAALHGDDCIRLTPDVPYQTGSAWFREPIDLSKPFDMRVQVVLGTKDTQGADGIVFVFHPQGETGYRGEGMGFAGLEPSLGIELDTYRNDHLADPLADHVALMRNGRSWHGADALPTMLPDLEDGKRHSLGIVWRPDPGKLEVHLDGELRATYPGSVVQQTFGGTPKVYWGMTAGTGRLSNAQDVCFERLKVG